MSGLDDFRDKLVHVLAVTNLSRTRLAKLAKVDKSVSSRWASGATRPTEANLSALTAALAAFLPTLKLGHWDLPIVEFRRLVRSDVNDVAEDRLAEASTSWLAERLNLKRPTIAVLPFRDLARTGENEAFCDVLTDALITALARLSSLQVIGRASAFTFKGSLASAEDAGNAMAARYIVEGQVQKAGERVRITAQLVDIREGVTTWADRFDIQFGEAFSVQDEIIRNICSRIDTKIILNQANALTRPSRPADFALADRIRAAMAINYGADPSSYAAARRLLDPILAQDPDNALALRTSAVTDWHEAMLGLTPNPSSKFALALERAQRSIELDPGDEYAYWICGVALMTAGRFEDAISHMQRALEISPNCSLAIGSMGTILAWAGHPDESIRYTDLAIATDPQNPSIFFRYNSLGLANYLRGHMESARSNFAMALSRRPRWPVPNLLLAVVEARLGHAEIAAAIVGRAATFAGELRTPNRLRGMFPFRIEQHFETFKADLDSVFREGGGGGVD